MQIPLLNSASWLDFKLGLRMLVRYPVLTVVGGLAMAFAIGAGAGTFEVIKRATDPSLPLPDGDRIVGLSFWDPANLVQQPPSLYDFLSWREGLRSVQDIGGFRLLQRNLTVDDVAGDPVEVAEISVAAFRVTRVPPLLGRTLVEGDERAGAPAVALLGYRLWHTRFNANPEVVGRPVRLGGTQATVVGVMPDGYAFPFAHQLWMPLRDGDRPAEPGRGHLRVFGRLASGAAISDAQAELTTVAGRAAAQFPEHYQNLRPQVLPYPESMLWIPPDFAVRAGIHSANVFAALFLVVICGNVALLMFARAATREREILVRGALGARRSRIVMQLFTEALVLGALAGLLGLTVTDFSMRAVVEAMRSGSEGLPFWLEGGLSPTTWTYAVLLTLLAAAMSGVVPALKITGKGLGAGLKEAAAGAGGPRMGGMWTVLIIAQIAATVVFTAVAYVAQRQAAQIASTRASFPAQEYFGVRLEMDGQNATDEGGGGGGTADPKFLQYYGDTVRELQRRLAAEPAVAAVTLAEQLPLMPQQNQSIEIEKSDGDPPTARREFNVPTSAVDLEFFDAFQVTVLSGRALGAQDLGTGGDAVVVNQLFVDRMLRGRSAVGRRIRFKPRSTRTPVPPGPWLEIVSVVRGLVQDSGAPLRLDNPVRPVIYRLLSEAQPQSYPLSLAARVRGEPIAMLPALRRIAAGVNPTLRLNGFQPLDQAVSSDANAWRVIADSILLVSGIALFLSLAGIYAVMSYTVSRRTREIAVRVALGAPATSVVATIFRRPLIHVAAGAAVGCVPVAAVIALARGAEMDIGTLARYNALLLGYGCVMTAVCALACVGPAVRALRVEPTEALREER